MAILNAALDGRTVVHRGRNHIPADVRVGQHPFPDRGGGRERKHDGRQDGKQDQKAKDLTDKGSNIGQILAAGQWSSTAFMAYQNKQESETKAVKALHEVDDSEEDGSDDE